MKVITSPSADDIRAAINAFDRKNKIIEDSLGELFARYRHNTEPKEVLLKVSTLNTLYSTQIPSYHQHLPTIFHVVDHIVDLGIDSKLCEGNDGLVYEIASIRISSGKHRFYYSFASKYCSWQNGSAYPIFDSRVVEYLWYLRKHDLIERFKKEDLWKYPVFKGVIEGFKRKNGLESFTFKEIDKFLYLQGGALLNGRTEIKVEEDGNILVPVPGDADNLEPSVEN